MKKLLVLSVFFLSFFSGVAQISDNDSLKVDTRPMKGKTFYLGRNGNIVTPKDYELKFSNSSFADVNLKIVFSEVRKRLSDKCFNVYLNQEKDFGTVTFRTASNIDKTEVNEWIKHLDAEVIEIKATDVE